MWDMLLVGAAIGLLFWGLINSVENRGLREKLAKFERVKDERGRFVSVRGKERPIKEFFNDGGNDGISN